MEDIINSFMHSFTILFYW